MVVYWNGTEKWHIKMPISEEKIIIQVWMEQDLVLKKEQNKTNKTKDFVFLLPSSVLTKICTC